MQAFAVNVFNRPLEPVERAEPVPQGTEVVVAVTRCGVCHSDLHIQDGYFDLGGGKRLSLANRGVSLPRVMGHEVLGRLVAKGPDAPIDDSCLGKSFLIYPWLGCGTCDVCRRGDENYCTKPDSIGVDRDGGYAEKCVISHPIYLIDVAGIDPTLAATYACSGLTAYSALRKVDIAKDSDVLLLLGLGGVGLSGLQIALGLGYRRIAVAETDPDKRELALAQGAGHAFDPRADGALAALQQEFGAIAAAVDFVGAQATAEFAIGALRKGGTYVVVGLFGGDIRLSIPPLVLRAITIRGSYVGSLPELRELIGLVRSGSVEPLPVESVAFDQVNDALDRLRSGKVRGRLVLTR